MQIVASKIKIDELSWMKNDNESQIKSLIAEKNDLTTAFEDQLQELQERLQKSEALQDKGHSGLSVSTVYIAETQFVTTCAERA